MWRLSRSPAPVPVDTLPPASLCPLSSTPPLVISSTSPSSLSLHLFPLHHAVHRSALRCAPLAVRPRLGQPPRAFHLLIRLHSSLPPFVLLPSGAAAHPRGVPPPLLPRCPLPLRPLLLLLLSSAAPHVSLLQLLPLRPPDSGRPARDLHLPGAHGRLALLRLVCSHHRRGHHRCGSRPASATPTSTRRAFRSSPTSPSAICPTPPTSRPGWTTR